jgi:hypothetical protein
MLSLSEIAHKLEKGMCAGEFGLRQDAEEKWVDSVSRQFKDSGGM